MIIFVANIIITQQFSFVKRLLLNSLDSNKNIQYKMIFERLQQMDIKEVFAQRLIQLREDNNITQQALADDLEITRQSLSLYEKADRTINIDLLYKIAKYFDVSADYLLGLTDNKTNDITVKAICEYTGLNDEAVESLADFADPYYLEPDPNEKSKENREMQLKILLNGFKIRNDFIPSDWFWDIIGYISKLDILSEQWENAVINEIRKDNDILGCKEISKLSKECDVMRYLITEKINEYINFYDKRIDEEHERKFKSFDRIQQLKEKILKEAAYNGKHNPSEE